MTVTVQELSNAGDGILNGPKLGNRFGPFLNRVPPVPSNLDFAGSRIARMSIPPDTHGTSHIHLQFPPISLVWHWPPLLEGSVHAEVFTLHTQELALTGQNWPAGAPSHCSRLGLAFALCLAHGALLSSSMHGVLCEPVGFKSCFTCQQPCSTMTAKNTNMAPPIWNTIRCFCMRSSLRELARSNGS